MSIQSQINRINSNITNAYSAIGDKGGIVPSDKNSANLQTAINSIPSGSTTFKNAGLYNKKAYFEDIEAGNFCQLIDRLSTRTKDSYATDKKNNSYGRTFQFGHRGFSLFAYSSDYETTVNIDMYNIANEQSWGTVYNAGNWYFATSYNLSLYKTSYDGNLANLLTKAEMVQLDYNTYILLLKDTYNSQYVNNYVVIQVEYSSTTSSYSLSVNSNKFITTINHDMLCGNFSDNKIVICRPMGASPDCALFIGTLSGDTITFSSKEYEVDTSFYDLIQYKYQTLPSFMLTENVLWCDHGLLKYNAASDTITYSPASTTFSHPNTIKLSDTKILVTDISGSTDMKACVINFSNNYTTISMGSWQTLGVTRASSNYKWSVCYSRYDPGIYILLNSSTSSVRGTFKCYRFKFANDTLTLTNSEDINSSTMLPSGYTYYSLYDQPGFVFGGGRVKVFFTVGNSLTQMNEYSYECFPWWDDDSEENQYDYLTPSFGKMDFVTTNDLSTSTYGVVLGIMSKETVDSAEVGFGLAGYMEVE